MPGLDGAPDIDTSDVETLIEYLRDKRIYLSIRVEMMSVRVRRTYRIFEQPEEDVAGDLTTAVRLAAHRGYSAIVGVDEFWDGLEKVAETIEKG